MKKNLVGVFIFIAIIGLSIGYSAYNKELMISGDATIRVDEDIRVTNIELKELSNAIENYRPTYSKDTTTISTVLSSSNSFITYEVTIENKSNDDYVIKEITGNNISVNWDISGIKIGDLIHHNSTIKLEIKISSSILNEELSLLLQYQFQKLDNTIFAYDYRGKIEEFVVPVNGTYKIELWGASGGSGVLEYPGGNGAYTSGIITLDYGDILYVNVGGKGSVANRSIALGGYNGGGSSQVIGAGDYAGSGGGATDIRLVNKTDFDGLKSRIMVAAGGGGAYHYSSDVTGAAYIGIGGAGGTLEGIQETVIECVNRDQIIGSVSSQITGAGNNACSSVPTVEIGDVATFGKDSSGVTWSSGGGGGYYGGGSGYATGASGGSSYISGYPGCNSIDEASTEQNIIHANNSNHYSNYIFTSPLMISGNDEMPNFNNGVMIGNNGDGYAKITLLH